MPHTDIRVWTPTGRYEIIYDMKPTTKSAEQLWEAMKVEIGKGHTEKARYIGQQLLQKRAEVQTSIAPKPIAYSMAELAIAPDSSQVSMTVQKEFSARLNALPRAKSFLLVGVLASMYFLTRDIHRAEGREKIPTLQRGLESLLGGMLGAETAGLFLQKLPAPLWIKLPFMLLCALAGGSTAPVVGNFYREKILPLFSGGGHNQGPYFTASSSSTEYISARSTETSATSAFSLMPTSSTHARVSNRFYEESTRARQRSFASSTSALSGDFSAQTSLSSSVSASYDFPAERVPTSSSAALRFMNSPDSSPLPPMRATVSGVKRV